MIKRILLAMLIFNIVFSMLDIVNFRKMHRIANYLTFGDFFKDLSKERRFLIVQVYILAALAIILMLGWIIGGDAAIKGMFEFVMEGWDYDQPIVH